MSNNNEKNQDLDIKTGSENNTIDIDLDQELAELDELIDAEAHETGSDFDPISAEKESAEAIAEQKQAEAAAQGQAVVVVAVVGQIIEVIKPELTVTNDQKNQIQKKLAPVLLKYSTGGVPPWLLRYQEELELAGALGMVGFSMYQQIKAAEAKEVTGGENGNESKPDIEK